MKDDITVYATITVNKINKEYVEELIKAMVDVGAIEWTMGELILAGAGMLTSV